MYDTNRNQPANLQDRCPGWQCCSYYPQRALLVNTHFALILQRAEPKGQPWVGQDSYLTGQVL